MKRNPADELADAIDAGELAYDTLPARYGERPPQTTATCFKSPAPSPEEVAALDDGEQLLPGDEAGARLYWTEPELLRVTRCPLMQPRVDEAPINSRPLRCCAGTACRFYGVRRETAGMVARCHYGRGVRKPEGGFEPAGIGVFAPVKTIELTPTPNQRSES